MSWGGVAPALTFPTPDAFRRASCGHRCLWGCGSSECSPTGGDLNYAGLEGFNVRLSAEGHAAVDLFPQQLENAVHSVSSVQGQAPEQRAPNGNGLRAQREGLDNITTASYPSRLRRSRAPFRLRPCSCRVAVRHGWRPVYRRHRSPLPRGHPRRYVLL